MKPHIQPPIPGSDPGQNPAKSRADGIRERRRRFLLGGISSFSVVTLASKPVLATGQRACTVSAVMSGNASRPVVGPCGSSPGCWGQRALSNQASAWTVAGFSPGQPFTSVFPMLNTAPWICVPSNASLLDAIHGGVIIKVKLTDGSKTVTLSNFNSGFPLQIVAGVLNAGFFGTPSYPLTVQGVKNKIMVAITQNPTSGAGATSSGNQANIRNAISSVTTLLDGYNNAGPDECPVV